MEDSRRDREKELLRLHGEQEKHSHVDVDVIQEGVALARPSDRVVFSVESKPFNQPPPWVHADEVALVWKVELHRIRRDG